MPRALNLDTIAPDDPIPPTTPKAKKIKKKSPSSQASDIRTKIYNILGHSKHPLTSFLVRPNFFSFREQADDEEIILVLRPHWFTNVGWIITAIIMLFVPIFLRYVPLLDYFPGNYQFIFILFWYLITFAFAFESFLSWYFDVYIITDERIIDINFNNMLVKTFAEAKISMIQDVSYVTVGLSRTLLNYATLRIQTASEIPAIAFEDIPNPEKVVKVLQQLRQEEELEAIEGRVR